MPLCCWLPITDFPLALLWSGCRIWGCNLTTPECISRRHDPEGYRGVQRGTEGHRGVQRGIQRGIQSGTERYTEGYTEWHREGSHAFTSDPARCRLAADSTHPVLLQILGMADDLTLTLGLAGHNALKLVPFGRFGEVLPWLLRRLEENQDALGAAAGGQYVVRSK